jgi:hypothetical protein
MSGLLLCPKSFGEKPDGCGVCGSGTGIVIVSPASG